MQRFIIQLVEGLVLLFAALGCWYGGIRAIESSVLAEIGLMLAGLAILWFGWSVIRRNVITRWLGYATLALVALIPALVAINIGLSFAFPIFLVALIAIPFVFYDLFFRAPKQGRFARAREARRNSIPN